MPSILLANVPALDNKMDHTSDYLRSGQWECCVFVFMETWLNDNILDTAIQLYWLRCYQADSALGVGGKTHRGGVCDYVSDAWYCGDLVVIVHVWWSSDDC